MRDAHGFAAAFAARLRRMADTGADTARFADPLARAAQGAARPTKDDAASQVSDTAAAIAAPLAQALDAMPADADGLDIIVRAIAPAAPWYGLTRRERIRAPWDPSVADRMAACLLVGPGAAVASDAVRAGLFLLLPGVHYPAHTHAADEVYAGLSGVLRLTHGLGAGARTFDLNPGEGSVTPPHRAHSLTPYDAPVLLAFAWAGAFAEPIYWWRETAPGTWARTVWQRSADGVWEMGDETPATDENRVQATGG